MNEEIDKGVIAPKKQKDLEGTGGILAMGILSIVFCGLIGLILGIIAITKANNVLSLYRDFPEDYTASSKSRAVAGRTCAIIGVSLFGLAIVILALAAAMG